MAEVAEDYQLDLLHVHYAIPHSISAMLAKQMMAARVPASLHHHAARHRHHAGRPGPLLLPHHQILHRAVRRHHQHQRKPAQPNRRSLRRAKTRFASFTTSSMRPLYNPMPQRPAHSPSAWSISPTSAPSSASSIASTFSPKSASTSTPCSRWSAMARPRPRPTPRPRTRH